jgi:2-C-methyl-D-erythritol 4-phosphate cytidylyltransferase
MNIAVIIPAAGASSRFQQGLEFARSKLDEDLGGRPVLQRTIEMFTKHPDVGAVIVAGPYDEDAMAEFKLRHGDKLSILGVRLVTGGRTHRYETIAAALAHVPDDATHIAVHDAARPCTPVELVERVFDAADRHDAVIPAIEATDTIKRVSEPVDDAEPDPLDAILGTGDGGSRKTVRHVEETVNRVSLWACQTPQVFAADLLRRAYAQDDLASTDCAQLVERLGEPVTVIEGDPRNIKITRPTDMELARSILHVHAPKGRPTHKRF